MRAEYAHVDAAAWRAGRGQVLRDLLDRDPLYATAAGRQRWAARAGGNMTAELASLSAGAAATRPAHPHRDRP